MEGQGITAQAAGDMKCSKQTRESVDRVLWHLDRMAHRLAEIQAPSDLRNPMQEVFARLFAAIHEARAIAYEPMVCHEQIIDNADMFDDIKTLEIIYSEDWKAGTGIEGVKHHEDDED